MEKTAAASPLAPRSEPLVHHEDLVGATGKAHHVAGTTAVLLLVALLGMLGMDSATPDQAATPRRGTTSAPTVTITGLDPIPLS